MVKISAGRLLSISEQYFSGYDLPFTLRQMQDNYPMKCRKIVEVADLLLVDTFVFVDAWDMEPCAEPFKLANFSWESMPNGDPEWAFMLNRQEYLYKLLLAWYFSGDEKYIEKLKLSIFAWLEYHPFPLAESVSTRTIDTGIRCMAWLPLLLHLWQQQKLTLLEATRLIRGIEGQLIYLRESYCDKYKLSNWGVLQTTAICANYLWLGEFFDDESLEQWAWQELDCQLELQVLGDGAQWEQSSLYHVEVLNACLRLGFFMRCKKAHIPQFLWDKLEVMAKYLSYGIAPDGFLVAQGDSDSGESRDVMVKAAILLSDGYLKSRGFSAVDFDTLFWLGRNGYEEYIALDAVLPQKRCYQAVDAGVIYIHSDFSPTASFTYLSNGALGSSHGHVDLTHISLYWQGKPFIVDCGRYTYREDLAYRPMLKSAEFHNVCIVDDMPHSRPIGAWQYQNYGTCMKNYFYNEGDISYAELPYTAVLDGGIPYFVRRRVVVIDPDIWISVQEVQCAGHHSYTSRYHLDDGVVAIAKGKDVLLHHGEALLRLTSEVGFVAKQSVLSKRYNELIDTTQLIKQIDDFENNIIDVDIIVAASVRVEKDTIRQYGVDGAVTDNVAAVWRFTISEDLCYSVVFFHQEIWQGGKVFFYRDTPLYGKCCVIRGSGNTTQCFRMRV